jgi:hypothetical protein
MITSLIKPQKNTLVCIVIGKKFYSSWYKNIFPSWKLYCKKNKIGLIAFTDNLIQETDPFWKKATWQRLLVGEKVREKFKVVKNVCVIDVDILINPYSPNIFKLCKLNKINTTSLRSNLPFKYENTIRKLAFFKREFLDKNYPLDSLLNCSLKTLYESDGLKPQKDEFCAGIMVFNLKKYSKILKEWFYLFKSGIDTTTKGGCQTQINYLLQKTKVYNLVNYKFQSIWIFEIASRFPHLMKYILKKKNICKDLVISVLLDNYFLHFAGSGNENKIWMKNNFLKAKDFLILKEFNNYSNKKLKGLPLIKINKTNSLVKPI